MAENTNNHTPRSSKWPAPLAPASSAPPPVVSDGFGEAAGEGGPVREGGGTSPFSLHTLREYKWTAILVTVLVAGAGLAGTWTLVHPKYRASATIEVHPTKQVVAFNTEDNGVVPFYQQFLYTQIRKLSSPKIIERVLKRDDVKKSEWLFGESDSLIERLLGPAAADARLLDALEVDNESGSSLIEVAVNAPDPHDAALVANAIVDEYLKAFHEEKNREDTEMDRRRREQEIALRTEIQRLEHKAEQIRANLKVLTPDELINSRRLQLDDLLVRKDDLILQLKSLRSMLAELESQQKAAGKTSAGDQPQIIYEQDPTWSQINEELQTARFELDLADDNFGEAHPKIVRLKKRIAFLEQRLKDRERTLDRLPALPAVAQADEKGTTPVPASPEALRWQIKQKEAELKHLDELIERRSEAFNSTFAEGDLLESTLKEIAYKQELYDTIKRKRETRDIERFAPAAIERESLAEAPPYPNSDPRKKMSLAVVMLALVAGIGAALVRGMLNTTVREPEELVGAVPVPFLGMLPLLRNPDNPRPLDETIESECVRMVRTSLFQRLGHRDHNVVQITSASASAGKSTFAIKLARSLAQCGKSVLLVDADLRNPTLARRMSISADAVGLIEALLSPEADARTILRTTVERLDVLPSGRPASPQETELLANGRIGACLNRWRQRYDFVLLDSSPLLPVADARILARHADGTILLAREGHSRREDVVESLACLATAGGELLGTVLVGSRRASGYTSGYYHDHYGAQTAPVESSLEVRK